MILCNLLKRFRLIPRIIKQLDSKATEPTTMPYVFAVTSNMTATIESPIAKMSYIALIVLLSGKIEAVSLLPLLLRESLQRFAQLWFIESNPRAASTSGIPPGPGRGPRKGIKNKRPNPAKSIAINFAVFLTLFTRIVYKTNR